MGALVHLSDGLTFIERQRLHRERLIVDAMGRGFNRAEARRLVFVRWLASPRGETGRRAVIQYPRREER
jgi:hypothetical protein